ncbi:hypothetical protein P8715_000615 [Escherichia coli]|nr:hypothetical protein [Escherichia coli]
MEIRFANEFEWVKPRGISRSPIDWTSIIEDECKKRSYTFKGFVMPWCAGRTKLALSCPVHGEWHSTEAKSFVGAGNGCPKCGAQAVAEKRRTNIDLVMENINRRCVEEDYSFVDFVGGKFERHDTKIILRCNKHQTEWTLRYREFVNKKFCGCIECNPSGKAKDPEIIRKEVDELCAERGLTFLGWVGGEYKNRHSKLILKCSHGHTWSSTCWQTFKRHFLACPCSVKYGYNTNKAGYIYVQRLSGCVDAIKFGITNRDPIDRMRQHIKKSKLSHELLFSWRFDNGQMALDVETQIKNAWKDKVGFVDRSVMGDGFTETLPVEILPNFLKDVKSLCNLAR